MMFALPAFRGVTRRIVVIALVSFLLCSLLGLVSVGLEGTFTSLFVLHPEMAVHRLIWQFLTYPFIGEGLLSTAFALLTLWFFGSAVENDRGSRWFGEYFLVATIGGGLLATLASFGVGGRVPGLEPASVGANGLWPANLALLLAFGSFHAEETISFNFILQLKAKYLVAIYMLFYLATALIGADRFGALTALCNGLCGYVFLRLAPRNGVRVGVSDQWFQLRDAYYRARRRRAARKFTVYMRKQGKDVNIDPSGSYIDPDSDLRNPRNQQASGKPRNPNDKSWMN